MVRDKTAPRPYFAWWVKVFSIKSGRVYYVPLPATDIDRATRKRIEGKYCPSRAIAEEYGYRIGKITASLYVQIRHNPDYDSLWRRIIPAHLEGSGIDKFIADRRSEFENGAGI